MKSAVIALFMEPLLPSSSVMPLPTSTNHLTLKEVHPPPDSSRPPSAFQLALTELPAPHPTTNCGLLEWTETKISERTSLWRVISSTMPNRDGTQLRSPLPPENSQLATEPTELTVSTAPERSAVEPTDLRMVNQEPHALERSQLPSPTTMLTPKPEDLSRPPETSPQPPWPNWAKNQLPPPRRCLSLRQELPRPTPPSTLKKTEEMMNK